MLVSNLKPQNEDLPSVMNDLTTLPTSLVSNTKLEDLYPSLSNVRQKNSTIKISSDIKLPMEVTLHQENQVDEGNLSVEDHSSNPRSAEEHTSNNKPTSRKEALYDKLLKEKKFSDKVKPERLAKQFNIQANLSENRTVPCECDGMDTPKPLDSITCFAGRITVLPGCPCWKTCARQAGQSCSPNEPCDLEFGLHCATDSDTCQGKLFVELKEVTHNSVTIQWQPMKTEEIPQASVLYKPVNSSAEVSWVNIEAVMSTAELRNLKPNTEYFVKVDENGNQEVAVVRTEAGCVIDEATSYGLGETYHIACDQTCTCMENNKSECRERCHFHPGSLSDPSCEEIPDEDDVCCVKYQCKDTSDLKVFVTRRTPTSLTIAWDDFKRKKSQSGYVVEYRKVEKTGETVNNWSQLQAGDIPMITIAQLDPNTAYQVRVSMWDDVKTKRIVFSYEAINVVTEVTSDEQMLVKFCVFGNVTYNPGETFNDGCDYTCVCEDSLDVSCQNRCSSVTDPQQNGDLLCEIVSDPTDPCCNVVVCQSPDENVTSAASPPMHVENKYHVNKKMPKGKLSTKSDQIKEESILEKRKDREKASTEVLKPVTNIWLKHQDAKSNDLLDEFLETGNETVKSMNDSSKMSDITNMKTQELERGLNVKLRNKEEETTQLSLPVENDVTERTPFKEFAKKAFETVKDRESGLSVSKNGGLQTLPVRVDGCKFKNETYENGDMFMDGCEAICSCEGGGRISCVPRCPFMTTSGPRCVELPDPSDTCCRIMVCEPKGSAQKPPDVRDLLLKIENSEALNATSVRIRVAIAPNKVKPDSEPSGVVLQVWYMHAPEPKQDLYDDKTWMKQKFFLEDLHLIKGNVYDVDIFGLEPNTQYYIKVTKHPKGDPLDIVPEAALFSNTVSVKTFPPEVQGVFQGCFYRNQSYDSGQVFYDGCELKCVCKEQGRIQCLDRCEIYMDTIGFEECKWGPAPDDPCCIIPYCGDQREELEQASPETAVELPSSSHALCTSEDGKHHQLGDTWEQDSECKRLVCTCVLNSNGQTMVKCEGGCPPIPADAYQPSSDCPQPIMVTPDHPCKCPYLICNNAVNSLGVSICEYKGQTYRAGEEFYDDCRAVCHCGPDLQVNCAFIECPHHFAPHVSECLEWHIDPNFTPKPPNCCPPPRCINDGSCLVHGVKYKHLQRIHEDPGVCGNNCVCVRGNVTCENKCPTLGNTPPPNLPCPPDLAYKGQPPGDKCCMQWMCREPERQEFCYHRDRRYRLGERWEVLKGSVKRQCVCRVDNKGNPNAECGGGCQPIPDKFKQPNLHCPRPVVITPGNPYICPYVVCNNTDSGNELLNVNALPLNATAAKIRFTLPSLLVGLLGHVELHYITDPSIPESEWDVKKFARPKRLFDTSNIENIIGGLKPETTYFFQIQIKINALHGGPTSGIFKLTLPALTTTTTITTTTTVPPMVMLDARLTSESISSNTVRISWRNFKPQEKRFIDGIRLKYKKVGEDGDRWITTPIIHPDVTSYILRDLEPSTYYIVTTEFVAPDHLSTHLVSNKPVQIKTLAKPKDVYDFEVRLLQGNVEADSTDFLLRGVPTPISKYVQVVRVTYRSDTNSEQAQLYKVPKTEKVVVRDLVPGSRYKMWVDLYLTNGKTVASDVINFMTKAAATPEATSGTTGKKILASEAKALQATDVSTDPKKTYYVALIIVAIVAAVAGLGVIVLLIILKRKQPRTKVPLNRALSESAYDNPTYKTFGFEGENVEDKSGTLQT
ncbi:uncharacterized protein LOC143229290 isoform X2 [Tachypleus tridentatus]|uniref:uncharacterized protein LOC143229290 isoform X2 n=1 Tax=Tachypleus tridentatus TaxID=6853 RepID=UPI003FD4063B